MRHIEILLPFGLPSPQLALDLVRELQARASLAPVASAFATLLARGARARPLPAEQCDAVGGALPHELWLGKRFALQAPGVLPLAAVALRYHGLTAQEGYWFILNPVHLHIARDHLVLTDQRQLMLSDAESRALFAAAQPYFAEAGHSLLYGDAASWLVRADHWQDMETCTPDAACGHNIDIWLPKSARHSASPLQWRKLQNEVQMLWHIHPVNEERQQQGLKPVNSLWLWGGALAPLLAPLTPLASQAQPFSATCNLPGALRALGQLAPSDYPACDVATLIATSAASASAVSPALLYLDALTEAALANDWAAWLERMAELESTWFSPLLAALKEGRIDRLTLILSHSSALTSFSASRHTLRKFWIKPAFTRLLP